MKVIKKLIEGKFYGIDKLESVFGQEYLTLVRSGIVIEQRFGAKLNFVGLLMAAGEFWYVLPKYYSMFHEEDIADAEIEFTQQILTAYGQVEEIITPFLHHEDGLIFSSKFQAAKQILDYYFEKGLIAPGRSVKTSSFDDMVNWHKTIEFTHPVFQDNTPVYTDPVSIRVRRQEDHIITEIQQWLTNKAFEQFGWLFRPNQSLFLESSCIESDWELYIHLLELFRQSIYTDDEIILINNLVYFLRGEMELTPSQLEVFGTKSFYQVWEKAVKVLWQDEYETYKKDIPYPVWEYDSKKYESPHTLIPDIIVVTAEKIFVVDAKYYLPKFHGSVVHGQPGVESISKQFVYVDVLKERFPTHTFTNVFCFPDETDLNTRTSLKEISADLINGNVNFNKSPYDDIFNIYLPPNAVFSNYVERSGVEINL